MNNVWVEISIFYSRYNFIVILRNWLILCQRSKKLVELDDKYFIADFEYYRERNIDCRIKGSISIFLRINFVEIIYRACCVGKYFIDRLKLY